MEEPEGCEGFGGAVLASFDAWSALEAGDPEEALARLEGIAWAFPSARVNRSLFFAAVLARYVRAEALIALSRHEDALRWVISPPHGVFTSRSLQAWSDRRAGDIHAIAGRRAAARQSYERYLELREDFEPVFDDEVAEVRAALVRL